MYALALRQVVWLAIYFVHMKNIPLLFLFCFLLSCQSDKKSNEFDINATIEAMSLEEKIDFIGGYESFNIRGYEQYGIPEIHIADGPVGVRNFGPSTAYPASIALAAAWDKKVAGRVGASIGAESRAKNVHLLLGPGMNIYRMPVCGRNFEYLGEDPYLAGSIAASYIKSMQEEGVMANAKHYVANNQEFNRHHCSSDMDERTLHEIYLPAFKMAVEEGEVASVMTAYNLINGVHASEHDYLNNQVLKGDWAFDGFIVSDWVSTYDGLACAKGGLDLEMPSGKMMSKENLIPAIESGVLQEEQIDDKLRRILGQYKRFGFFQNPDLRKNYVLDSSAVRLAALDAARGGMVLLKNDSGVLPISKEEIKSIAVIGPNAEPLVSGGGGSSGVQPLHPKSLLKAIQEEVGESVEINYEKGIFTGLPFPEDVFDHFDFYIKEDGQRKTGVNAVYFAGKNLEGEPIHRQFFEKIALVDEQMWGFESVPETNYSIAFDCYFSPKTSGYYTIGMSGDDGYRLKVDGIEQVDMWRDQGDTRSKYSSFMNAGQEYAIRLEYYQSGGEARLRMGIVASEMDKEPKQYTENAMALAKNADLVVLSVGFGPGTEGEAFDRSFELPYDQGDFIRSIAEVNKNIVVVLNAGGNVDMNTWIDEVPALLMAWYPGQEGNIAAAEILFGKTNPSGKLPVSFEYELKDNPCFNSYYDEDEDLSVFYSEGIFMGYRYWDKVASKPRFDFGYGLSYSSFRYSDLEVDKMSFSQGDSIRLSLSIENIGGPAGAEVIQLYVEDDVSSVERPVKELKAFDKVFLQAGEKKTVEFVLDPQSFMFYDEASHGWRAESGTFTIHAASSSTDIRESITIELK